MGLTYSSYDKPMEVEIIPDGIKRNPQYTLSDWCFHGYYDEVVWMLKNGSDVKKMDRFGKTPLYKALDNPKIVKALIVHGVSMYAIDIYEKTPLIYACERDVPFETIKLLIKDGSDVNASDRYKKTPLHYASNNGRDDIVNLLIQNGAKKTLKDCHMKTPYENLPKCFKNMMHMLE